MHYSVSRVCTASILLHILISDGINAVVRDVQETSHADTQAEEVAGPVAGERPDGRARNKLGKVELRKIYETSPYLTFTLEQLRHELTSRNIAFSPYLGTRKLIFQLLRDDYRQECI